MFEKYRHEVLQFYEAKKAAGEVSMNLMNPTTTNLRNECKLHFIAGYNQVDERMLKEFFALPFGENIYGPIIWRSDPDKFKPLNNFLKKGIKTHEKNIEMLAWLIDFKPRPFSTYWRVSTGKNHQLSKATIMEQNDQHKSNLELAPVAQNSTKKTNIFLLNAPFYLRLRKIWEYVKSKILKENDFAYTTYVQKNNEVNADINVAELRHWSAHDKDPARSSDIRSENQDIKQVVILEYPSGVKLSVEASNLSLISQLVQL